MAVIRDMMPDFELYQPTTIADAVALLGRYGKDGWALGGGMDTFDWLKDRVKRVKAVIDLSGIEELRGIRPTEDGGIEIGAMTTLTEVATHPDIRERYWVLAEAARKVASPQIRNQATIGGQRVPGCPLLVLPGRPALLPGRGEHVLCGHSHGHQPGALPVRSGPVRGGKPV